EVNVAGYDLHLVTDGRSELRSRVIVGDQDRPTPIFDNRIRYTELNPSWYVPASIFQEMLDKEKAERGYLERNGFVVRYGADGRVVQMVQRPGPDNALGRLKFGFPNTQAVYLHDTPNRGAFARSERTLSHGCIRVEKALPLALALLAGQGW